MTRASRSTRCPPRACRWRSWRRPSIRCCAKTRLVAETVYSSDSQSSLARIYGSALAIGETIEEVRRWPIDIEAVTQERLKSAAEYWLTPARSVTGYLTKAQDSDAPVAMAAE
jgi:zinc protease